MIIGLIGNLGRGKTLGMTMLGHYLYHESKLNNVVANYQMDLATHYVTSSNELVEASENVEGIYLLDELWAWMNSRESMENDEMVELVLNSRKRGCLIVYTVQDLSQVDKILRNNTDYYGICSHYDATEIGTNHDVAEVQLVSKEGEIKKNFKYNAETYYGTYDTTEEISSVKDVEKLDDIINDIIEGLDNNKFNSKKEAWSYLDLHTSLSHSKKDSVVDEAFRRVRQNQDNDEGGEN